MLKESQYTSETIMNKYIYSTIYIKHNTHIFSEVDCVLLLFV